MIPIEFIDYRPCSAIVAEAECKGFMLHDGSPGGLHRITGNLFYNHKCNRCGLNRIYGKMFNLVPDLNFENDR